MTAKATFAVSAIRALVRDQAETRSLRSVALEIPMSLTALRHFLKGGKPQASTLEKLVRWYGDTKRGDSSLPAEDVQAAIALLQLYISRAGSPKDIAKRRAAIIASL